MAWATLEYVVMLLALTSTSAFATTTSASKLSARGDKGIYGCEGSGWKGPCWWQPATNGNCHGIGKAGSFGPDKGIVCQMFSDAGCDGNMVGGIRNPGTGDLSGYIASNGRSFWGQPKSFACKAG